MTTETITRYVRYAGPDGVPHHGILEGEMIRELEGDIFGSPTPTGKTANLADVKLLTALDPYRVRKVLGIAGNYNLPGRTRLVPHGRWFCKMPTSLNAHEGEIEVPPDVTNFNFEGELVLVIGKEARHVTPEEAPGYIWGVTVGNDFSENDWTREEGTESRFISKGTDSWAALYHTIVKGMDYSDLQIEIRLNGELGTRGRTPDMVCKPAYLVSYLSHFITLEPGDIIYTGTVAPQSLPGTRKQLRPGDVGEVEIENIGTLRNTCVPFPGAEPDMLAN
jgi:2-keto-4-pentenoate hydratase/2-oxohepta-3-ene-1,7-dioic acid hydratase in catechol pathway